MLGSPLAHVKWFADPAPYPTLYGLLLSPTVLLALVLALGAVGLASWIERTFPEPRPVKALEGLAWTGPLVLGLHIGVALTVAAGVGVLTGVGLLFVPALQVPLETALGVAIIGVELMCGLMFLLGLATRAASVLLALLGIVAMAPFTFESMLEQVHILGIAVFLFLVGRGPFSLDRLRGVKPPIDGPQIPATALALVRVAMGFAIFYGALTEKLLNPPLAQALLDARPWLNVAAPFGIADGQFAYLAGVTELAIGAVLISGSFTRPTIAIGAAIFSATLPLFGWSELLGHLPFYGIMFLLLICPKADSPRVRRALRPAA